MLLSTERRFIFVHIPKTAGQSISRALLPWAVTPERTRFRRLLSHLPVRESEDMAFLRPHGTARWFKRKLAPETFDNYFKFAVVRNPFDYLVSYYHYLRSNETSRRHADATEWSFAEFLAYMQRKNRVKSVNQLRWLTDIRGRMLVNDLIRFESLEEDFSRIVERVGLGGKVELPHINQTDRTDYRDYYGTRERALAEEIFGRDLETLNYRF